MHVDQISAARLDNASKFRDFAQGLHELATPNGRASSKTGCRFGLDLGFTDPKP